MIFRQNRKEFAACFLPEKRRKSGYFRALTEFCAGLMCPTGRNSSHTWPAATRRFAGGKGETARADAAPEDERRQGSFRPDGRSAAAAPQICRRKEADSFRPVGRSAAAAPQICRHKEAGSFRQRAEARLQLRKSAGAKKRALSARTGEARLRGGQKSPGFPG